MKLKRMLSLINLVFLITLSSTAALAGDFDWMKDFNIRAEADSSGFRARLETRFKIGDVEINAVLGNVKNPADAYMILRLGEMSSKPSGYVIKKYKSGKGQGWGALAKSLGIKPGSKEFHALKNGDDIYYVSNKGKSKGKDKNKGKNK